MLELDIIDILSDERSPSLPVLWIFLKLNEFLHLPSHVAPEDKMDAHVPFDEFHICDEIECVHDEFHSSIFRYEI